MGVVGVFGKSGLRFLEAGIAASPGESDNGESAHTTLLQEWVTIDLQ